MANGDVWVSFGGDTSGLTASLATARATVNRFTRDLAGLSREYVNSGAAVESELGQKLLATAGKVDLAKKSLADLKSQMQGATESFERAGAAAAHGGAGLGLYLREFHALADELSSGRYRNAESTFLNLSTTFLMAHASLVPMVAAAGEAAAAIGFFAYQAISAKNAMQSLELDAAVAQMKMTDGQASQLASVIAYLADVSKSGAADIAKPFLALGPGGDLVAAMTSQYLPMLSQAMGEDAPKAAAKLAEMFADLGTKGRAYVAETRGMTAAQLASYDGFVSSGQVGQAYAMIIDSMVARLEAFREKQLLHNAAVKDSVPVFDEAGLGAQAFGGAEDQTGGAVAATTAKIDEQIAALKADKAALLDATDAQRTFMSGLAEAFKVDKVANDIRETTAAIAKLKAGMAAGGGAIGNADAIAEQGRALDILTDKMKKLRQEAAAGLGGGDAVSNMKRQFEIDDSTAKGPDADRLKQHQAAMQELLAGDQITAEQRKALEVDVARNARAIQDAENESYLRQDEAKVAAAGKNSAAVIAIRQAELQREISLYGEGSKQAEAAEDRLARAKEAAANRGSAAAAKAAKDALAGEQEGYAQIISNAEKTAQDKIKLYGLELKAKQITEAQKLQYTLGALAEEKSAVAAAYASELALAGTNAKKLEELQGQLTTFNLENAFAVQDAYAQAAIKATQAWDKATSSINSAFDSQISGLVKGTESWHSAFTNVLADLTTQVLKFGVNAVLNVGENFAKSALGIGQAGAGAAGGIGTFANGFGAAPTFAGAAGDGGRARRRRPTPRR